MSISILVDSGNYFSDNDNVGDRAIYAVIARRLRDLWPECQLHWITRDADLLRASCPDVSPLGLTQDREPLEHAPAGRRFPRLGRMLRLVEHERDAQARPGADAERLLRVLRACDLVLATGGGYFSDSFASHAWTILDTLEAAVRSGKPAVIASCGFEPIRERSLSEKMLTVLPQVSLIACREAQQSPAVVRSFGVEAQRVALAGDDAIELAFSLRPPAVGSALGLNLRQADYSGVDAGVIERLRETLARVRGGLAAPLVSVPISLRGPSDLDAIRSLASGLVNGLDERQTLTTPEDVMRQAGRCRLVITGSYHAAVFALAQGVSVVALTASPHYRSKLHGLRDQFGTGCRVVALEREDTNDALVAAIEAGWSEAEAVRPELLRAAQRQMVASHAAYERVRDLVPASRLGSNGHLSAQAPQDGAAPWSRVGHARERSSSGATQPRNPPLAQLEREGPGALALSPAEIETFRDRGFVGPFTAFEARDMERVRQTIYERVLATPTPYCPFGLRVRHLDSRTVYELCSARAIVERMQSLFGPDLVLWNSNLFNKPPAEPGRAEEYPWHQDHYNWNMEPVLNVSAWLAIGPATLENGCVEVIPGSHRQIVPPVKDTDPRLSLRFGGVASDPSYVDTTKKVALPLEPGQFFLFNERLLHHSSPNRTRQHRLGLAVRVTVPIVKVSEPFPCVLLSGEDRMGFNRYVTRPTGEPDADWLASLPRGHTFAFDRPIPGMGWHLRETDGQQHFAWTGLEPEAWIELRPVERGDHVLRCDVVHMLSPLALETLRVYVNGQLVILTQRRMQRTVILEARIPEGVLQARPDRVRIVLAGQGFLRPCDVNPSSPDKRALGLGVSCIALTPTGAAAPLQRPDA